MDPMEAFIDEASCLPGLLCRNFNLMADLDKRAGELQMCLDRKRGEYIEYLQQKSKRQKPSTSENTTSNIIETDANSSVEDLKNSNINNSNNNTNNTNNNNMNKSNENMLVSSDKCERQGRDVALERILEMQKEQKRLLKERITIGDQCARWVDRIIDLLKNSCAQSRSELPISSSQQSSSLVDGESQNSVVDEGSTVSRQSRHNEKRTKQHKETKQTKKRKN